MKNKPKYEPLFKNKFLESFVVLMSFPVVMILMGRFKFNKDTNSWVKNAYNIDKKDEIDYMALRSLGSLLTILLPLVLITLLQSEIQEDSKSIKFFTDEVCRKTEMIIEKDGNKENLEPLMERKKDGLFVAQKKMHKFFQTKAPEIIKENPEIIPADTGWAKNRLSGENLGGETVKKLVLDQLFPQK